MLSIVNGMHVEVASLTIVSVSCVSEAGVAAVRFRLFTGIWREFVELRRSELVTKTTIF